MGMFYLTLAFLHASYKKTTQWLFKAIPIGKYVTFDIVGNTYDLCDYPKC